MVTSSREFPNNAEYVQDIECSIQVNRWLLKSIGAWPTFTDTSLLEKIRGKILAVTCQSFMMFTVIPCALYVIFEEKDTQLKLKTIGPLGHVLMGIINCSLLMSKSDQISSCIQEMELDWRSVKRLKDREVMLKYAKFGSFVSLFSAVCMQLGGQSFVVFVGTTPVDITVDNLTVTTYQLLCRCHHEIVDVRFSPATEIVLVLQFISCFFATAVTVSASGLAVILTAHSCGQFHILLSRLDEFVDNNEKAQRLIDKKLGAIVQYHLRILSFIERVEEIMHQICFVELVGSTLQLCIVGYYCLMEWNEQDAANLVICLNILIARTLNIFLYCYIGQILQEQCQHVGEKAYMIEWYYLPRRTALSVILIIIRSSAIMKITAGKLFQLSVATFGEVVKSAVVYLNILRTMTT